MMYVCMYRVVFFVFVLSALLPFIHNSSIYCIHRVDFIGLFWLECSLLCMFVVGCCRGWLVGAVVDWLVPWSVNSFLALDYNALTCYLLWHTCYSSLFVVLLLFAVCLFW